MLVQVAPIKPLCNLLQGYTRCEDTRDVDRSFSGHAQVQKSASHYTEAARDEITLLTQIRDGDPTGSRHCVRLFDWFEHRGPHGLHICMVFEVFTLGPAIAQR